MLYGKGVFTTLAIQNREPFVWPKHCARLRRDARKIDIDLAEFDEAILRNSLANVINSSPINVERARITLMDERPSEIWPGGNESEQKTGLYIMVGEGRPVREKFRLTYSPYTINSRSPLAGVKSCNYLENILTLNEAKSRGFDETVRLNENGTVTSAAMTNLFWLSEGVLNTPSLSTGCLAGTTREFVLENMQCEEVEAGIEDLRGAEAIFLTSAGLGVVQVAEFESRKLTRVDHPITRILPWTR